MKDNYLENIRNEIINGNAKVVAKNYQINNVKLAMNYNIGKELAEAGKHYGEGIVKKYAKELTNEFGTNYGITNLKYALSSYQRGKFVPQTLSYKTNEIPSFISSYLLSNSRILPLPMLTSGERQFLILKLPKSTY